MNFYAKVVIFTYLVYNPRVKIMLKNTIYLLAISSYNFWR